MQKYTIFRVFITAIIAVFLYSLVTIATSKAQELTNYAVSNISNISTQITPALLELEMRPGESRTVPVLIENSSLDYSHTSAYLIKPQTITSEKFEILRSTGDLQNIDKWLEIEKLSLNEFNIKITIPKDTKPGQYYPIVIFSPYAESGTESMTSKDENKNVAVSSELSTTFFINIIGDFTDYKAKITDLSFKQSNAFSFPTEANYSITNTGDTFFRQRGEITMTAPNGNVLSERFSLNKNFEIVLAGDTLTETFTITNPISNLNINNLVEQIKATGKYKISIEAVIDQNQTQKIIESREFYYVPTSVIVLITGFAIIIVLAIIITTKRILKKYQIKYLRNNNC